MTADTSLWKVYHIHVWWGDSASSWLCYDLVIDSRPRNDNWLPMLSSSLTSAIHACSIHVWYDSKWLDGISTLMGQDAILCEQNITDYRLQTSKLTGNSLLADYWLGCQSHWTLADYWNLPTITPNIRIDRNRSTCWSIPGIDYSGEID